MFATSQNPLQHHTSVLLGRRMSVNSAIVLVCDLGQMVATSTIWVHLSVSVHKTCFFLFSRPSYQNSLKLLCLGFLNLKNGCCLQKIGFSYKVKELSVLNRPDTPIKKVTSIGETLYIVKIFYIFFLIFLECMQSC